MSPAQHVVGARRHRGSPVRRLGRPSSRASEACDNGMPSIDTRSRSMVKVLSIKERGEPNVVLDFWRGENLGMAMISTVPFDFIARTALL
eukprot:IDg8694t1